METVRREYEQDGWIWQAEEVRKGDRWERFLGFVGPHRIARVPAAEIELGGGRRYQSWESLPGGLDASLEPVEPRNVGDGSGQPIHLILRIRNRRGVESAAPTEFLRRGEDGRPLPRRGVTIPVFYAPPHVAKTQPFTGYPGDALTPKRTDQFTPVGTIRLLAPFEDFEAMRFDLNDWFDVSKTGSYRVDVAFAADAGVGKGTSNDWTFTVGHPESRIP